jgi:hypothetical protein
MLHCVPPSYSNGGVTARGERSQRQTNHKRGTAVHFGGDVRAFRVRVVSSTARVRHFVHGWQVSQSGWNCDEAK